MRRGGVVRSVPRRGRKVGWALVTRGNAWEKCNYRIIGLFETFAIETRRFGRQKLLHLVFMALFAFGVYHSAPSKCRVVTSFMYKYPPRPSRAHVCAAGKRPCTLHATRSYSQSLFSQSIIFSSLCASIFGLPSPCVGQAAWCALSGLRRASRVRIVSLALR